MELCVWSMKCKKVANILNYNYQVNHELRLRTTYNNQVNRNFILWQPGEKCMSVPVCASQCGNDFGNKWTVQRIPFCELRFRIKKIHKWQLPVYSFFSCLPISFLNLDSVCRTNSGQLHPTHQMYCFVCMLTGIYPRFQAYMICWKYHKIKNEMFMYKWRSKIV